VSRANAHQSGLADYPLLAHIMRATFHSSTHQIAGIWSIHARCYVETGFHRADRCWRVVLPAGGLSADERAPL